jgi:hypothetical protein
VDERSWELLSESTSAAASLALVEVTGSRALHSYLEGITESDGI